MGEFDGVDFGADRGINYQVQVGGGQNLCQSALSGTADNDYGYANTDKIAQYVSGSTVRVVWPAKNHANYECFGNIPDTSMKLYWNPSANPTADLTNAGGVTMITAGYELVKDWQEGCTAGSDGCGFQNCPKFCENTDRATCFGDFVVPDVDTAGYYTFVWYWIFNPGAPYISCYEAYVTPASETSETGTGETGGDDTTGTDGFAESSGNGNGVLNGYLTQAPICLTHDGSYDSSTLDAYITGRLSAAMAADDELEIISMSENANALNFTIQISHASGGAAIGRVLWDGTKAGLERDDTLCDDFVTAYPGTTCANCEDVTTYALYKSGVAGRGCVLAVGIALFLALFV